MKCVDCGASLADAKRRDRKYCATCQRKHILRRAKESDAKIKAARREAKRLEQLPGHSPEKLDEDEKVVASADTLG